MKMESVRYSAERNEPFWHEEIDDIGRYLRLAAEFGCTEQGEALCRSLESALLYLDAPWRRARAEALRNLPFCAEKSTRRRRVLAETSRRGNQQRQAETSAENSAAAPRSAGYRYSGCHCTARKKRLSGLQSASITPSGDAAAARSEGASVRTA